MTQTATARTMRKVDWSQVKTLTVTGCDPECRFVSCPVKTGRLPLHDTVRNVGDDVLVIECNANPFIANVLAQFAGLAQVKKWRSHG
jgi:hypothetical protein